MQRIGLGCLLKRRLLVALHPEHAQQGSPASSKQLHVLSNGTPTCDSQVDDLPWIQFQKRRRDLKVFLAARKLEQLTPYLHIFRCRGKIVRLRPDSQPQINRRRLVVRRQTRTHRQQRQQLQQPKPQRARQREGLRTLSSFAQSARSTACSANARDTA